MPSDSIARLQAAAVDGRAHSVFYRQAQLERLCNALLTEQTALRNTMIKNLDYSPTEAIAVLHAALRAVKDSYATLQPKEVLDDEYRIARGRDAPDSRTPLGLIYIEPSAHTLLYSVCAPLSAAMAAGNCVLLLLENDLREVSALLRRTLTSALDADTFAVIQSPIDIAQVQPALILRSTPTTSESESIHTISPSDSPVVAVVDRTADMQLAAREIVAAMTSFGGQSPYAPTLVLVNEFVISGFLRAVQAGLKGHLPSKDFKSSFSSDDNPHLLELDVRTGTLAPSKPKTSIRGAMDSKANNSAVFIQSIRSLDDAINILDEARTAPYMAAYHFSDLKSAKYLSQFVDAEITFVDHIPRQLLLGSTRSDGCAYDLEPRYPPLLFTQRRPAYVKRSVKEKRFAAVLQSGDEAAAHGLLKEAIEPLRVMKRSEGGSVGFFEQGFFMNASFILAGMLTLSATGAWQLWKYQSVK